MQGAGSAKSSSLGVERTSQVPVPQPHWVLTPSVHERTESLWASHRQDLHPHCARRSHAFLVMVPRRSPSFHVCPSAVCSLPSSQKSFWKTPSPCYKPSSEFPALEKNSQSLYCGLWCPPTPSLWHHSLPVTPSPSFHPPHWPWPSFWSSNTWSSTPA